MHHRLLSLFLLLAAPAHAVFIRGHITTPLGAPIPGARIQLIQGALSVGDAVSGLDGSYEIRSGLAGRFVLLTSSRTATASPSIQIGSPFYAGSLDLLTIDVALDSTTLTPQTSAQSTLHQTPLPQLADPPQQLRPDELLTQATVIPELRPLLGAFLVQQGPLGAPAFLYLRGAGPESLKVEIDGVPAEDLGGGFNLGSLSSSGLSSLNTEPAAELSAGANPLHGLDAEAGVLSLHTPLAQASRPTLTYTGDAGNLAKVRNEAVVTLTHTRADLLASFARLDTSNETPGTPFHLATSAANVGYQVSGSTSLRLTLRDDVAAGPPPSPIDFFGLAPSGRLASQNLYSAFTFDTLTARGWHNQLRYGLARKRQQDFAYATPASGLPVTITGANGFSATGAATFPQPPGREDFVTNRDEYSYQTDYRVRPYLAALLTVRYADERGADLTSSSRTTLERNHLSAAVGFTGEIHHRVFYETSGLLEHSPTYGFRGAPRLGLTYAVVRPGSRRFRGTSLHATAATGFREPSLLQAAQYPTNTPRSRTFDVSVDQQILPGKLTVRAAYFHNQFSHDFAPLTLLPATFTPTLAYRTQGIQTEVRYQPFPRVSLCGGYTYLASLVEQSTAPASFNPNLPSIAIGALSALPGARPFQRPPLTGFLVSEYSGRALNASIKATLVSRSDDSTGLIANPALLLPNRNLSPGYASLDVNGSYAVTRRITVFTELTNLANDRHIAPLGYRSTPFAIRTGLRIRLGGE